MLSDAPIRSVHLPARDAARARQFYEEKIGLTLK